jgi:ketosteroid isomerase-like protein
VSEENVEIVRRVYEAAASGDSAAVFALYDPAVEWDASRAPMPRLIGGGRVFHGHDGLRRFFEERNAVWGEIEDVTKELIDAGEHVVSADTERGRGRSSGVEVEMTQYAVWTIRDGRVTRVVWFPTRAEALEAAGLSE